MADEVAAGRAGESSVDADPSEPEHPTTEGPSRRAFKVVHPKKSPMKSAPSSPPVRSPLLPLIAATLGLVSLLLPWAVTQTYGGEECTRLTDYMTDADNYEAVYAIAGALVLAGSVLSLVSPYGSLLTLAGVSVFVFDRPTGSLEIGIGLPVAAAAAAIGCASIIWTPRIALPRRLLSVTPHPMGGHRLNILAFAAFVVAVASIVLPWVVMTQHAGDSATEYSYTLASEMDVPRFGSGTEYAVAHALVIAGAALCLLTPLGGAVVLSGTLLFFHAVRDVLGDFTVHQFMTYGREVELGTGFFVCLVAGTVATVSTVRPYAVHIHITPIIPNDGQSAREPSSQHKSAAESDSSRSGVRASMAAIMASAIRPASVIVVVLLMLVAAVMLSSALPFSSIIVQVSNGDARSVTEVAVYVDGELVDEGLVSAGASLITECSVDPGPHHVELDFALIDFEPEGPDGLPDWSGSVEVGRIASHRIFYTVMTDDLALPVVTLEAAGSEDHARVTVVESVNYAYGVQFTADIAWYDISLVLTDGTSFAEWEPDGTELSGWSVAQSDLGAAFLGDLNINCTVTDLAGDGQMSQGDYFDLTATSESFAEDVTYTLYVLRGTSVVGEVSFTG